ncbi:hypothetical protein jhhlp_005667 [Lomentospora prolificans]|uniref:Uncharacterized protein n=1 Tax=Lomentospora prolificans TaxID=41688 RepID=A0A2N3N3Q4_9PEZI|nr:hypothetical protein jhhlp_005667 [Lomentospora prolificans]
MSAPHHYQPQLSHLAPSAAIFSPSVARVAASTARDWNYVDSWLSTKFHGRAPPSFERNPETLKALLALAAYNEAADEEQDVFTQAEAVALSEVGPAVPASTAFAAGKADDQALPRNGRALAEFLLDSVETSLTKEGRVALNAMANVAAQTGIAFPEPEQLGRKIVEMQGQSFALEQTSQRLDCMVDFLRKETDEANAVLRELHTDGFKPPTDLAKKNLELHKTIKLMADSLPELRNRLTSLSSHSPSINPRYTFKELEEEEARYLATLDRKKELESQVAAFQGLPSDSDVARAELDSLRSDLINIARKRDMVFENLVERESPKKRPPERTFKNN